MMQRRKNQLTFHTNERFKHLIGNSDDLRVGLESTLSNDHIRKLVGKVNIGHLKC